MPVHITKKFHPKTRAQWREWLGKHHATEPEIWVVQYRKSSGKQTVTIFDLIDEALCFGWIDSVGKGIDEETFALRFSPRKKKSSWSAINKQRYQALLAQGLVTEAGKKAYASNN